MTPLHTLAGLVVPCALLVGCTRTDASRSVQEETDATRRQTVPSDATLLQSTTPTVVRGKAVADWEFETSFPWDEYARWVGRRLNDFQRTQVDAGDEISFVRATPTRNETFFVHARCLGHTAKYPIHVRFEILSE